MRILLVNAVSDAHSAANKDLVGGLGSKNPPVAGLRARALAFIKGRSIKLPSLSMAYVAAIFAECGHQVEVATMRPGDAPPAGFDLILVLSSLVECHAETAVAQSMRRPGGPPVGFWGTFASAMSDVFLPSADFVIQGEPESAIYRIARGETPSGLMRSEPVLDLDRLPFPKWDLFPVSEYPYFPALRRRPFLTIQSSRGCPYPCGYYCGYIINQGNKARCRTPENVVDEIQYLVDRFGIRSLLFRDPIFTLERARVEGIATLMLERGVKVEWACETHLNHLDEKLITLLRRSGLRNINVGIEGVDDSVLGDMHRKAIKGDRQRTIVEACERQGVQIAGFYIIGLRTDTAANIRKVIDYAKDLNTTFAQFTICTPYPGTPFFTEMQPEIVDRDWEHYNGFTPVFAHANLTHDELIAWRERAMAEYYVRPRWAAKFIRQQLRG